ncbi:MULTISPECIES: hypothetical protein [Natrialbaceae]|uniref:hypothetical protein n=1 Tax=Natrialbaceae TaxID=1644061 RepID=UPI00207C9676|nr:hypothetical protein [Natronococcus sp. CG52]
MNSNTSPASSVRWTAFKRTFFAILTVALAAFVVWMDGQPTAVFFGALVLLLVAFGVELRKVELPPGLTITFGDEQRGKDRRDEERDDRGE